VDEPTVEPRDDFGDDTMSRRRFFNRVAQVTGASATALGLAGVMGESSAGAQVIAEKNDRLAVERAEYDAAATKMAGYLARLKGGSRRPAVLVIHENRGLTPHIQDVARRFAVEGFLAFAPDILSPFGGTPADDARVRELFAGLNPEETVARLAAAVPFLAKHRESTGKVGVVGFCWGGGMANRLAAAGTSLNAAVPYYGTQLPAAEVPKISAPLLLHYAALDERIDAGIPAFEAALKANKKPYELFMYEGAQHAFNNDSNPERYNKAAADLAWTRTVAFLKKHLGT
jgi:carboxymethylenebutenolidase